MGITNNMFKTLLPVPVLVLLAGCAPEAPAPKINIAAEQSKLRDADAALAKDWAAKDFDKILAHYTDEAVLMTDGMNPMTGKDGIGTGLKGLMSDPNLKLEFSPDQVDVAQSGELGYSRGHYVMTLSDPKTKKPFTTKGPYLTVYKKDAAGNWMIVEDINTPGAK